MDVEVDESDLLLHFADAGWLSNSGTPTLSPVEKFKLMYSIAETFVQLHKMSRFPDVFGRDSDRRELSDLIVARDSLTKKVMERPSEQ
jgi:hypothetical protein